MTAIRKTELRLRVDPIACDAYGYCAELLPERITIDEWGYPNVDGMPVEPELLGLARRAVATCPRRALHLHGTVVPSRSSEGAPSTRRSSSGRPQ